MSTAILDAMLLKKPVISICAVRTGVGKSQVTRYVGEVLKKLGKKYVVIRHPMPYGVLKKQVWQRYETYDDLKKYNCTIEEREEYEPHIKRGEILYAGVDYGEILKRAEKEAFKIADVFTTDSKYVQSFYKNKLNIDFIHLPAPLDKSKFEEISELKKEQNQII